MFLCIADFLNILYNLTYSSSKQTVSRYVLPLAKTIKLKSNSSPVRTVHTCPIPTTIPRNIRSRTRYQPTLITRPFSTYTNKLMPKSFKTQLLVRNLSICMLNGIRLFRTPMESKYSLYAMSKSSMFFRRCSRAECFSTNFSQNSRFYLYINFFFIKPFINGKIIKSLTFLNLPSYGLNNDSVRRCRCYIDNGKSH